MKKNRYEDKDDYMIGYTEEGRCFYFDKEDYDLIKAYYWSIDEDGYVLNWVNRIWMHRLVMNCPPHLQVDHIHHNKVDNRKNELRICTNQQNSMNHNIARNNTHGATGVFYDKRRDKWYAGITINGKYIHLGTYINKEDAIFARREGEIKYYKEYAIQESKYNINDNNEQYKKYLSNQYMQSLLAKKIADLDNSNTVYSSDGICKEIKYYDKRIPYYLVEE